MRIFRGFWSKWQKIPGKFINFIISVATTTRMAIEHLPFPTLQNAAFGPGTAKISILQGRGTTLSQNHPKIRGFQKSKFSPLTVPFLKFCACPDLL